MANDPVQERPENPPAFPGFQTLMIQRQTLAGPASFYERVDHPGMTLRDYFAGQAMQALLANPDQHMFFDGVWDGAKCNPSVYAKAAYEYADAMLTARTVVEGEK